MLLKNNKGYALLVRRNGLKGRFASVTAENIKIQPLISRPDSVSPKAKPVNTANTDSKLNNNVTTVGLASFCAMICKVYAIPLENTPIYKRGAQCFNTRKREGDSNTNINTVLKIATVKN